MVILVAVHLIRNHFWGFAVLDLILVKGERITQNGTTNFESRKDIRNRNKAIILEVKGVWDFRKTSEVHLLVSL
jgi:hypothetical protein